jgi:hypothetical protein
MMYNLLLSATMAWAAILTAVSAEGAVDDRPPMSPAGQPTYCREIAPILWRRCAPCHRPGQPAPFSLLTYAETKRHKAQIAKVTAEHLMPPWLPNSAPGEFTNDRRLSSEELDLLQRWIKAGALEGNPTELPPVPTWSGGWALGPPDLVVSMAKPYPWAAEGSDEYRNFVLPIPTTERRYVRAWEFRPGNARIVHHAFLYFDRTRQSRRLAAQSPTSGFPAMNKPDSATQPEGEFMSYQPGKTPQFASAGMAWVLE